MLMWVKDAPKYGQDTDLAITNYIDKHVSCSAEVAENLHELVDLQRHKHSRTCRKRGKPVCWFGFPMPPMSATKILTPLDNDDDIDLYKEKYHQVKTKLDQLEDGSVVSYAQFLEDVHMSEQENLQAIRSSLQSPKVFLAREPSQNRVNPYMKLTLNAWQANHDVQFVLDAYACAVYIVAYFNKGQRGMSALLDQACKEARLGNSDLKKQVRHMGNKFLNAVEISA